MNIEEKKYEQHVDTHDNDVHETPENDLNHLHSQEQHVDTAFNSCDSEALFLPLKSTCFLPFWKRLCLKILRRFNKLGKQVMIPFLILTRMILPQLFPKKSKQINASEAQP